MCIYKSIKILILKLYRVLTISLSNSNVCDYTNSLGSYSPTILKNIKLHFYGICPRVQHGIAKIMHRILCKTEQSKPYVPQFLCDK